MALSPDQAGGGGDLLGSLGKLAGKASGLAAAATPIGAAAMAALSIGKGVAGLVKQKKADAMMPKAEDPEERALASYAQRRKRAFQTGTAMAGQRNAMLQAMKTGVNASFKVGGGAKGLNMMTRAFNQQALGMQNQAQQGELAFAQMEDKAIRKIADRKLQLGLLKYNTEQARAAQMKKEGKSNMNALMAKAIGIPQANPYGNIGGDSTTTGTETGVGVGNEK